MESLYDQKGEKKTNMKTPVYLYLTFRYAASRENVA